MLKYEFFQPAIKGLSPTQAARVTKCLEAAMLFGAVQYAEGRDITPHRMIKRYSEVISAINAGETFGDAATLATRDTSAVAVTRYNPPAPE